MKITILFILSLVLPCSAALGNPKTDESQKEVEYTMVDILCSTSVIKDMNAAGDKYFSVRDTAKNSEEEKKLKIEFGQELHTIWLKQNYQMRHREEVMKYLDYLLTLPMADQAEFARSWSFAAQKRCPAVAQDYRATYATAMTLISVIPH